MGVSYDKNTKTWSVSYEDESRSVPTTFSYTVPITKVVSSFIGKNGTVSQYVTEDKSVTFDLNATKDQIKKALKDAGYVDKYQTFSWLNYDSENPIYDKILAEQTSVAGDAKRNDDANKIAASNNQLYKKIYDTGVGLQSTKEPGNYLTYIGSISGLGSSNTIRETAKNTFDDFYKNEIVSLWDQKDAAKVPYEGFESVIRFDPDYYATTDIGKTSKDAWGKAEKDGDLDLLGRYGNYESYALWHYSNIGQNDAKKKGVRDPGFKPITPTDGFEYEAVEESVPGKTDAERQFERDKIAGDILGLKQTDDSYILDDVISQYESLLEDKDVQKQWETAKSEIFYAEKFPDEKKQPWAKLYDAITKETGKEPDIETEAGFGEFLVKANQLDSSKYLGIQSVLEQVKAIPKIAEVDTKLSEYDVALTKVTGEAEAEQTKKAAVLQKEFLEDTRKALIQAKKLEQNFELLSNTSFGQELLGLRENIANSLLQDTGIGGILAMGGQETESFADKFNLSFDTGKTFGSNNGLLYNWEKWFYDEIEKKYSGGLDVPNDYVPLYQRTEDNGFISADKIESWKKYDDAYKTLETNPNSLDAKEVIKSLPEDYVPVAERKQTKQEWIDYEAERKKMGWVDNETLALWADYDDAYKVLNSGTATQAQKEAAQKTYDSRPADYIDPSKRIDSDVKFAQDFFNDYLMPRFNTSKSILEFRDYINVDKDKQNIFQTEDRLRTLKNAAEAISVAWMKSLDKLSSTKFNSDYYFDPAGYYIERGIGAEGEDPVLLGSHFQEEWGSEMPKLYVDQKADVESAWEAAKNGLTTKDKNGNEINWGAKAYLYGFDLNNKEDFAKLHYELVGKDNEYDSAPDVFTPQIADIYLKQVLTPYLASRYSQIGTVFGQFVNPDEYASEVVDSLDPIENKEQVDKLLKLYGLDSETDDLSQLKKLISDSIKSGTALDIRDQIKEINRAGEIPTQELLGVEYIQRETDVDKNVEEEKSEDALFNRFKEAGYKGTEEDFYADFMPDATEEDKQIFQSLYAGKSLTDKYTFKPTGDPFTDLGRIEELSSFGDEEKTLSQIKTEKQEETKKKSSYFTFFPDEAEEDEEEEISSPVTIKRGKDILAEFKSKLKLPTAQKADLYEFDNPFSSSFFGS